MEYDGGPNGGLGTPFLSLALSSSPSSACSQFPPEQMVAFTYTRLPALNCRPMGYRIYTLPQTHSLPHLPLFHDNEQGLQRLTLRRHRGLRPSERRPHRRTRQAARNEDSASGAGVPLRGRQVRPRPVFARPSQARAHLCFPRLRKVRIPFSRPRGRLTACPYPQTHERLVPRHHRHRRARREG